MGTISLGADGALAASGSQPIQGCASRDSTSDGIAFATLALFGYRSLTGRYTAGEDQFPSDHPRSAVPRSSGHDRRVASCGLLRLDRRQAPPVPRPRAALDWVLVQGLTLSRSPAPSARTTFSRNLAADAVDLVELDSAVN